MSRYPPRRLLTTGMLAAVTARVLGAQPAAAVPPRHGIGSGFSLAAGLAGVEYVRRSTRAPGRPPVGVAAGAGLAGVGGRVHVGLGPGARAPDARRVPYAGLGLMRTHVGARYVAPGAILSAEAGVQHWPAARGRAYFDIGGSAFVFMRRHRGTGAGTLLRAVAGVAF